MRMKIISFELELHGEPGTGKSLFIQRLSKLITLKKGESLRILSIKRVGENRVKIQHVLDK